MQNSPRATERAILACKWLTVCRQIAHCSLPNGIPSSQPVIVRSACISERTTFCTFAAARISGLMDKAALRLLG